MLQSATTNNKNQRGFSSNNSSNEEEEKSSHPQKIFNTGLDGPAPIDFITDPSSNTGTAQFKTEGLEEDELPLQGKNLDEEKIQKKSASKSSNGMPQDVQAKMESSFGTDFSNVNIHANDSSATQMGALAYTQGNNVHFAPGQYNPSSQKGQELLGHELTHVVQQRQGIVEPTRQGKGVSINDSSALEKEADDIGQKISTSTSIQNNLFRNNPDGSNTQDSSIQFLKQPITEKAPQSAMKLEKFISLIEDEENKYSLEEQRNTSLMITRIRKIFYGSKGWDENLIKNVDNIKSPYGEPQEKERKRTRVEILGPANDFDMVDKETYPVDSTGNRPEIYKNQEVQMPNGDYIDLGHVFAGLDAFNHRHSVDVAAFLTMSIDNVEGTTWVGDLGSALAESQINFVNSGNRDEQNVVNEYASAQDMLGNIDSYAIAQSYDIAGSSMKVSEILRHYYLGAGVEKHQSKRYTIFAEGIGLKKWDGSSWGNEEDRIEHYTDQVNDAAAMYIGAGFDSWNIPSVGSFITGISINERARIFVKAFFDALKVKTKSESKK